jgi:RNA polymerase sigma factor (sigma-70 family)
MPWSLRARWKRRLTLPWFKNEIKRAMSALSSRQRAILKLYFEDALSQSEIAERLGISYRIVRREFEKSYIKMRCELKVEITGAFVHGPE